IEEDREQFLDLADELVLEPGRIGSIGVHVVFHRVVFYRFVFYRFVFYRFVFYGGLAAAAFASCRECRPKTETPQNHVILTPVTGGRPRARSAARGRCP